MPPPKRRRFGCQRCCFVWFPVRDGQLTIGCAHCPKIYVRVPVTGDKELLDQQVRSSHAGHKVGCGRPIR